MVKGNIVIAGTLGPESEMPEEIKIVDDLHSVMNACKYRHDCRHRIAVLEVKLSGSRERNALLFSTMEKSSAQIDAVEDLEDTIVLMAEELQKFCNEGKEAGNELTGVQALVDEFHQKYTRHEEARCQL